MLRDDKAMFTAADKNHDGLLDANEFISFTHPEEDEEMLPIIYEQTLAEKDKNGDKLIDFKEYIGDRGKNINANLKSKKKLLKIKGTL